jgi:hypothetical protein
VDVLAPTDLRPELLQQAGAAIRQSPNPEHQKRGAAHGIGA